MQVSASRLHAFGVLLWASGVFGSSGFLRLPLTTKTIMICGLFFSIPLKDIVGTHKQGRFFQLKVGLREVARPFP